MSTFFPYTPRQETLEDLRACFVGRESLLNELLDSIREQSQEKNLQHWMILGSRGLGKSHLIALLYHSVKEDHGLSGRWIPLLMKEEEHGVFSLHTLFTRILTVLSEEVERDDPERASQLASYLSDLKKGKLSKEDILEGVLACLKDFAGATSTKLLVLAENTDDLFTRCVSKTNEIKRLRKILQHDNHILLIATSPGEFGRMSSRNAPLYQFFRIRTLELLSFEQALEVLNCWSKMDPDRKEIGPFRREDTKLRVLYHLTGGNPRLLLFLYMAVSGQGGIKRAVDTFSRLLEQDLSNYYLSRLRELSNQEQPIVIALAEADRSLTQKEIAQQTFLPQASIGTSMMRLENRGIVRPVSGKKGKNTPYTLTDHLFRLWYKWRTGLRERKVIEALVEFLGIWYRRKELQAWSGEKGSIGLYCREALQFRASEQFRKYTEPFKMEAETDLKEKLGHRDYGGFFDTLSLLREWTGEGVRGHVDPVLEDISNGAALDEALDYLTRKLKQEPDSLDAWVDAGILLDKKGDLARAAKAFEKAVELDPKDVRAWLNLALARSREESYAGAERAFAEVVELDQKDAGAWLNLGIARRKQENYAGAEQAYAKAVELDPKHVMAWLSLGLARGIQKNKGGAEQAFTKAVELDPKHVMAWLSLGLAREDQDNHTGAEQAYAKAVELDPKDASAWLNLGTARWKRENYAGAEQALERAVELDPKDASGWFSLGIARGKRENYAGAEQALERAVELDPKDARAWYNLGTARWKRENYAGAEQAFEKAVELDPKDARAWYNLGRAREEQKNHAGADQAFEKAVELDPKDARAWLTLGESRWEQGNHAGAEQAFKRALVLDPDDPLPWNGLVVVRFKNYSFKEAWEASIQAIELGLKERAAYGNLVEIYLTTEVGNPISVLERAVEAQQVDPGFQTWLSFLRAMVSLSMGDRTPFMRDLKRAADILESLEEEQRTQIVGELMDFLVGVTYRHTLERVEAYFAGLSQAVAPVASILAPLGYVLDYFRAIFLETHKKGPIGKQAEQVLDRVPGELRKPVDDMVRQVKQQQAWWDRRPKKVGRKN